MIFERLNLLAQITGGKMPATEEAWKFWLEQMSGIPATYVLEAINNWAKHSAKFPAPVDIRKEAHRLQSDFIEEQHKQKVEQTERISDVRPADPGIAEGMKRKADVSPIKWAATLQAFPHGKPTDPAFIEECRQTLVRESAWQMNLPRPSDYATGVSEPSIDAWEAGA